MTEFVYVLSYNPFEASPSETQVQTFLRAHRAVTTWYYPFLGTFIFKSPLVLRDLAVNFRQFFGDSSCVLTYVTPALIGGSLPQTVWDWINDLSVPSLSNGS